MNENTTNKKLKRVAFWGFFVIIIALIIWGLVAANGKSSSTSGASGSPSTLPAPVTASDWTIGSSSALVTIVEYADFECPACQDYAPILKQLVADENSSTGTSGGNGDRVRFVYRYFPLPQHPNATISAEAAQAAGAQGQFWAMHDMLFANYSDWENLSDPTSIFIGYAAKIGISTTTFLADLTSPAVDKVVTDSYQTDVSAGLNYTPTVFINGTRIDNPSGYAGLKALVDAAASSSISGATK
jgi:protein-disulfide isomerase